MICILFIVAGNLVVNVLARTRDFVRNMGAGRRELRNFRRETRQTRSGINQMMGSLRTLGLGIGAGALVGGATSFLRNQAQVLDALGKTGTRLGVNVEALQLYQFAADQAGVATNTFNMALQRMTRRIGEFQGGTGEAKDTLEDLGFTAEELGQMLPEEQFAAILDQLMRIDDANERLAKSFKVFDSEGVAVLQMGGHLQEAKRNFDELNLAIDAADVGRIEELVSSMGQLAAATTAMGRQALVDISPEVQAAIDGALELIRAANERPGSDTQRRLGYRQLMLDPVGSALELSRRFRNTRDAALLGDLMLGGVSGQMPLRQSETRSADLAMQRQFEVGSNPRQMGAGAMVSEQVLERLDRIDANTRPAQTQRDGT